MDEFTESVGRQQGDGEQAFITEGLKQLGFSPEAIERLTGGPQTTGAAQQQDSQRPLFDLSPVDFPENIHTLDSAEEALSEGVVFEYGPDTPELRKRNSAKLADHLEQRRNDWREVTASAKVNGENRRLNGRAKKSIDGIISDVSGDMTNWAVQLYVRAGRLAGWHDLGFVDSESKIKAALLNAAAPWNDYEEDRARMHIDNGWNRPIPPKIPTEILESFPAPGSGIPAETPRVSRDDSQAKAETNGKAADFDARPSAVSGDVFILDDPKDVPALWGNGTQVLWAEGEALMLASLPGLGKTTLAGLLVRAQLGLGDGKVLGLPVREIDGNILYLAMDRPTQIGRSMARQFTEADRTVLRDRLIVRKGPPPNDLATDPDMLLSLAKQYGASVVYVDSLKDGVVGLSDDKAAAAYNRARQTLTAAGIQLCELHHCRKMLQGNEQTKALSEIYGSVWLTAGAGSVILLTGDSGDTVISFEHVKPVLETVGPLRLLHDQVNGRFTVDESADLFEVLKACGSDGLNATDAARHMFDTDKPTKAQKERARRRLDKLVENELATVCGGLVKGGPPASFYAK